MLIQICVSDSNGAFLVSEGMPSVGGGLSLERGTTPVTSLPLLQYLLGLCAACLPTVMSSSKKKATTTRTVRSASRKRVRRETWPAVAPLSDNSMEDSLACIDSRQRDSRYSAKPTADYVQKYLTIDGSSPSRSLRMSRSTVRLKEKVVSSFAFDQLPQDCQLKIFTFLSPQERGFAARVCTEWNQLMKTPSLWNIIDLTSFPLCSKSSLAHKCGPLCYEIYKRRLKHYIRYLEGIGPAMKSFSFALDIVDYKDGWLKSIEALLRRSHCHDLEFVHLNWKETPIKPLWLAQYSYSPDEYQEYMHRHRHRQRLFVNFFDCFTCAAPNIQKLILPFDWSDRSLECLCRLQSLHALVLEKTFIFQGLQQSALDQLFAGMTNLQRLILEVWTPSGKGLLLYRIQSQILRYLDVSQCHGFYLQELTAPDLEVFKVSRHPWKSPFTCVDSVHIPCIYDVLCKGAPNLKQLNEHTLHPDWNITIYAELDTVLHAVCSCRQHKAAGLLFNP